MLYSLLCYAVLVVCSSHLHIRGVVGVKDDELVLKKHLGQVLLLDGLLEACVHSLGQGLVHKLFVIANGSLDDKDGLQAIIIIAFITSLQYVDLFLNRVDELQATHERHDLVSQDQPDGRIVWLVELLQVLLESVDGSCTIVHVDDVLLAETEVFLHEQSDSDDVEALVISHQDLAPLRWIGNEL